MLTEMINMWLLLFLLFYFLVGLYWILIYSINGLISGSEALFILFFWPFFEKEIKMDKNGCGC